MEYLLGVANLLWVILKVAVGIGFVIFVHELGHFLVAKMCGVKVEKFLVGFDVPIKIGPFPLPRTLWKMQWGETLYAIGVIPLGGYVKMLGQDDNPANYEAEAERTKLSKPRDHEDVMDAGMVAVGVHEDERGDHVEPLEAVGNHEGRPQQPAEIDPRSYTAKSVPQRMAIISAGVIMNVIFAFIMGAVAYGLGVSEMPAVISGTNPGSPAWIGSENWEAIDHLLPGDKIVQVGREGAPYEHLRFKEDVMIPIFLNGTGEELDILIERDGERHWVSLRPRPSDPTAPRSPPAIGVELPLSLTLGASPVLDHLPAGKATPPFEGGDKIVAVDGEPVEGYPDLQRILVRRADQPLTFTVERESEETSAGGPQTTRVDIPVGTNPMRTLGLHLKAGPVIAVQVGSPAHAAGVKAGDEIVSIDGEPLGDPLTLGRRLRKQAGEEVPLVIRRGGVELELTITPQEPVQIADPSGPDSPVAVEEIGVAFHVLGNVVAVDPDSPAAGKLEAGDRIMQAEFVAADEEQQKELLTVFDESLFEPMALSEDRRNWPQVHSVLQQVLPGTKLKLTYVRNGATRAVTLDPVQSEEFFNPQRGVRLTRTFEVRQASSFGEALALGARETKERFMDVLLVLGKLLSGQLSITNLSGPAGIAYVAGAEASQGIGNLLVFLVFLSVNLAIVNALPIPVLDGGHFVFLLWEGIIGKPVSEKWVIRLTFAGLIFLLGLMVFVTVMDIGRFAEIVQ
ncbi:MAG: site-2 protease family protein [Planctomycetes bacterium]|nr:site-2 protease family protein [Planctomycetota bacterium]